MPDTLKLYCKKCNSKLSKWTLTCPNCGFVNISTDTKTFEEHIVCNCGYPVLPFSTKCPNCGNEITKRKQFSISRKVSKPLNIKLKNKNNKDLNDSKIYINENEKTIKVSDLDMTNDRNGEEKAFLKFKFIKQKWYLESSNDVDVFIKVNNIKIKNGDTIQVNDDFLLKINFDEEE